MMKKAVAKLIPKIMELTVKMTDTPSKKVLTYINLSTFLLFTYYR